RAIGGRPSCGTIQSAAQLPKLVVCLCGCRCRSRAASLVARNRITTGTGARLIECDAVGVGAVAIQNQWCAGVECSGETADCAREIDSLRGGECLRLAEEGPCIRGVHAGIGPVRRQRRRKRKYAAGDGVSELRLLQYPSRGDGDDTVRRREGASSGDAGRETVHGVSLDRYPAFSSPLTWRHDGY